MDSKTPVDIAAGAVALGTVMEWIPALASLLTIIWMSIRIYQTLLEIKSKKKDKDGTV